MPRGVSRLDEARVQGRLWTPHALRPSVVLWLEAGEGLQTLTLDTSDRVTVWSDRLGLRTVTGDAVTGTNRPLFVHGGNPYPKVNFSAVTLQFLALSSTISYTAADGLCMVAMVEFVATRAQQTIFGHTNGGPQVRLDTGTSVASGLRAAQANLITSTATMSGIGPHIVSAQFQTNYCEIGINGSRNTNATNPAFTQPIIAVGSRNAGAGDESMSGGIVAALVCSRRLSIAELARVEGYFMHRYGRAAGLIGTHPFRNSPPLIGS